MKARLITLLVIFKLILSFVLCFCHSVFHNVKISCVWKKLPHKWFKITKSYSYNLFSNLRSGCKQLAKHDYLSYLTSVKTLIVYIPKKILRLY